MQSVKIGALLDWQRVAEGEVLGFNSEGERTVKVSVNSSGPVTAFCAAQGEDRVLVGHHSGLWQLEYSALGDSELWFEMAEGVTCFIKGHAPDHKVIADPDKVSFTTIEPRRSTTEIDRMLYTLQQNEAQRQKQYAAMLAREELRIQRAEQAEAERQERQNVKKPKPAQTEAPPEKPVTPKEDKEEKNVSSRTDDVLED